MTTTKGTVPKKNAPAGGLTGLTFYEQNCNDIDGISLVGVDFNTCLRSCWSLYWY